MKSILIEQAIKSLLPTQNGRFRVILLSFRIALSIPLVGRYPYSLDVKGRSKGHSYGHRRQLVRVS